MRMLLLWEIFDEEIKTLVSTEFAVSRTMDALKMILAEYRIFSMEINRISNIRLIEYFCISKFKDFKMLGFKTLLHNIYTDTSIFISKTFLLVNFAIKKSIL